MKIHEVVVHHDIHHEVDPIRGHVARRVEVLKPGSTHKITHQGVAYTREADGSFEMPPHVAAYFLKLADPDTHQPVWYEGVSPFEPEQPAKVTAKAKA